MPRTDLSLGYQDRVRAPYRALCVEVIMQAVRDRRRGHTLTDAERHSLRWWTTHVSLRASFVDDVLATEP
jgi:hypothetical protein